MKSRSLVLTLLVLTVGHSGFVGASSPDSTSGNSSVRARVLYGLDSAPVAFGLPLRADLGVGRSIPLAAGLSALVPGLGQAYNGQYWKTAIFAGIEAALIAGWVVWKRDGNNGVDAYEAYARQGWSPIAYAEWLSGYGGYGGDPISLPSLTDADFQNPAGWTAAQQSEVRVFFDAIRAAEDRSVYLTTGAGFSHVLPYFGEQQYYELIGKYFQYAPGWDDYRAGPNDDPEASTPEDSQFYYYAGIHADANDQLRRASRVGGFVLLNHFVAAIEAAVSAKLHNDRITANLLVMPDATGEPVTTARVTFRW